MEIQYKSHGYKCINYEIECCKCDNPQQQIVQYPEYKGIKYYPPPKFICRCGEEHDFTFNPYELIKKL
jgi:hypothetical protein